MIPTACKYFILSIPALVCLVVFANSSLQTALSSTTPVSFYTSNFVHSSIEHLSGNVVGYTIFVYLSFRFFREFGYERVFWFSFTLILLFVPIISSVSTVYLLQRPSVGLSGVVSAFIGLYAFTIVIFLIQRSVSSVVSFLLILLFGMAVVSLIYRYYTIGVLFVVFAIALILKWVRKLEIKKKDSILLFSLLFLYLTSMVSIFPQQLVYGNNFINILAHYVGFFAGYMIPWLLRKW
jgi:membrane associated rhomboid family serine protease